jgi:hypothetical protein
MPSTVLTKSIAHQLGAAFALVYTRDGTIQPAEQPSTPAIRQIAGGLM